MRLDSIENLGVTKIPKPHPGIDVTLLQSDYARMMPQTSKEGTSQHSISGGNYEWFWSPSSVSLPHTHRPNLLSAFDHHIWL